MQINQIFSRINEGEKRADTFVVLGDSNLVLDTSFGIQLIDVKNVVVHPSFANEQDEEEHDIGW